MGSSFMLSIGIHPANEAQRLQPVFNEVSGSGSNSTRCAHNDASRSGFFECHPSLLSDAVSAWSFRLASGGVVHLMDGESGSFVVYYR